MSWIRLHPIVVAAISALILVGIGTAIAASSFAVKPSNGTDSWGSIDGSILVNNTLVNTQPYASGPRVTPDDVYAPLIGLKQDPLAKQQNPTTSTPTYIPKQPSDPKKPIVFDDAALTELFNSVRSGAAIPQALSKTDTDSLEFADIYSYLPFSLKPWKTEDTRTATQSALFDYANTAGSIIETYEDHHRDQAEVLKRFTSDMTEAKAEDVLTIAADLQTVGDELLRVDNVPQAVKGAHARMAAGYQEMGKRMEAVATARTPESLFDAMVSYNEAADAFAQHFINISTTLQISEVSFGENDPGKMFVFTPA